VSVFRTTPLLERHAVGHLVVPITVVNRTQELLRQAGARNPPHEGLVWWLGRQVDQDTLIMSCHQPSCRSGPDFVFTDEAAAGATARLARSHRLGLIAQVHSHPGRDTHHSEGDDELVLMPFEGMFSLVVGDYGNGSMLPSLGASLHQFQSGQWVLVQQPELALIVVPAEVAR
jgi:proteasome lid subunit RPN8/RPN11